MKNQVAKSFVKYLYDNFIANFISFAIGLFATRLVAHFFVTRSIKNLWGLAARRTVIDKKTYSNLELLISVIVGFIVFELLSNWLKQKMSSWYPVVRMRIMTRLGRAENAPQRTASS